MSQQINLFNPIFLKQEKYFSAVTMAQSLGLMLLGALALALYTNYQVGKLTADARQVQAYKKATEASLKEATEHYNPEAKNRELLQRIAQLEAEIQLTRQVETTLENGDFGNTRGYSEEFLSLARQAVSGLWLTNVQIIAGDTQLNVHGRALTAELVPDYLNRLKREKNMQGKSFEVLTMQVPEIETSEKTSNGEKNEKKKVPAAYIEFDLQSRQTKSARADGGGAT